MLLHAEHHTLLIICLILSYTLARTMLEDREDDVNFCKNYSLCHKRNNAPHPSCSCKKEECQFFGDCCRDVILDDNYTTPIRLKCKEIIGLGTFYVVNTCPFTWTDDNVNLLCNKNVDAEDYHYILDIPFQTKNTSFLYANIYCAVCNDALLTKNELEVGVNCSNCSIDQHKYMPAELRWIDELLNISISVKFKNENLRACGIGDCARNWIDEITEKKCHSFTNIVKLISSQNLRFRNIYCAICNFHLIDNFACSDYTDDGRGDLPLQITRTTQLGAFTALMDFSATNDQCPQGKYPHQSGVCIPTLCGKHFVKENGVCMPKLVSPNYSPTVMSCEAIPLPAEELHFTSNGTIVHNSTNHIYTENEYEVFNDSVYLVCLKPEDHFYISTFPSIHGYLSVICMSISLICLAAHIAVHCIIGKYKNLPDKCLFCFSSALFLAQFMFIIGIGHTESETACLFFAIFIHYFYLAVFFWMNVMAFDIWITFSKSRHRSDSKKTFIKYSAYAWLLPVVIVCVSVVVDNTDILQDVKPHYGFKMCWISHRFALFVYFALPLIALLVENAIFFCLTAYSIYKTKNLTKGMKKSSESIRFRLYVKLAFIMGGTWLLGIAFNLTGYEVLAYVFIVFNASQGTFVFLVFTLKKGILNTFWGRLRHGATVVSTSRRNITSFSTKISELE